MKMHGMQFVGKGEFKLSEIELRDPGEGEILVKNMVCGVCGTDVHIFHGEPGSADVVPPVVLGHEYSGIVEKIGSGVTDFSPGDKVTIDPNSYCGTCRFCRNGKKQMCEGDQQAIGVTKDGGFAEYSLIPAAQAYHLAEDIDFETGAMTEPLACCIHGMDLAGIRAGTSVLIVGGGAIGLIMVQLARLAGASPIIVSEPVELRRKVAISLGADFAIDPLAGKPEEQIHLLTGLNGADVVIECAGILAATKQAVDCAAKGATILLFSVPKPDAVFGLPLFDVFKKELTIKGSFINPDTHNRAVQLINSKRIDVSHIITHRFRLSELEKAIKTQMGSESIKVVVKTDEL
jgi:2-desacetyl-2-hydroxyethyl bacteriochlorophyllide A dehydrogenase